MPKNSPDTREVAILGAAGFTGRELLRILAAHPFFSIVHVTSDRHAGSLVSSVFSESSLNVPFKTHADPVPESALVFLATPNDVSLQKVPELLNLGHRIIDLSGVYRLHSQAEFKKYYKLDHTSFELMDKAAYGLPEIFSDKIKDAGLVANPGCFPTGSILPLQWLSEHNSIITGISIDAKSGVSGAGGRVEDGGFSFTSVYENFRAYKILGHQHFPEIAEYPGAGILKEKMVFTPHLLPLFRGILSTITIFFNAPAPDLKKQFVERAKDLPFIRIQNEPEDVDLLKVQRTNFLDIGVRVDGNKAVIVTALDNLVKGAAGQAVQNANIMMGFVENTGLV